MYRFDSEFNVFLHLENNPIDDFNCNDGSMMKDVSLSISWSNIKKMSVNCNGDQFRVVKTGNSTGISPAADGKYEIYCDEESFPKLKYLWIHLSKWDRKCARNVELFWFIT